MTEPRKCACCNAVETPEVWVRRYKLIGSVDLCKWCCYAWYDDCGTDYEGILRSRFPEEFAK